MPAVIYTENATVGLVRELRGESSADISDMEVVWMITICAWLTIAQVFIENGALAMNVIDNPDEMFRLGVLYFSRIFLQVVLAGSVLGWWV